MKKILIIGESDSVYIKEYVEYMLKENSSLDFSILTMAKNRYLDFYKDNGIKVILMEDYSNPNFKLTIYHKFLINILKERYDFIHVQAVSYNALKLATIVAGKRSKVIASYWAYSSGKQEIEKIGKLLGRVYKISFVTKTLMKDFQSHYGHIYDKRISCMDLVMSGIENMKHIAENKDMEELRLKGKNEMGFPKDKVVVAVGYCGRKDQQHLQVLNSLETLPNEILQKLYVYIHVAYGITDEAYIRRIEAVGKRMEKRGCICNVSKEYIQGERLAYLRFGADVFINGIKQDVLSATMLEYLCGGAMVFNGNWLNYSELDDVGLAHIRFNDFKELPMHLMEHIEDVSVNEENAKLMWTNWSWSERVKKWIKLYH